MLRAACGIDAIIAVFRCLHHSMFYAVRIGRNPGIYTTWDQCFQEVKKFPQARYKKFATRELALAFLNEGEFSPALVRNFENNHTSNMSNSKVMNALKSVQKTAKTLQQQIKLVSSSFGTLSEQIETLEEMVQDSSGGSAKSPAGQKRSNTDEDRSGGKKSKTDSDSSEAAGWSGNQFDDPDAPCVYTDGACFMNGKKGATAGIGVYWGPGNKNNFSERLAGRPTNNRAEIHAALKAVKQAKGMGKKNLVIHTDSEFLINSITKWIKGWKKKGWVVSSGGPVANKEDFQELDEALTGINVKWVHVRGHAGIPGNEAADRLANAGARKELPS